MGAALLLVGSGRACLAQIPGQPSPGQQPQQPDTIEVEVFRVQPPVSPLGGLWRSLLVPGWGQSILGRRVTGAFFVFWEGVTLGMTLKSVHQLDYLERIDSDAIEAKKQEVQDWAVLLAFNHLVAGAEAFVSSLLWDFPEELEVRAFAGDGVGLAVRIPLPR